MMSNNGPSERARPLISKLAEHQNCSLNRCPVLTKPKSSTMKKFALIELRDLSLNTLIGTYGPHDTKPDTHLLDLTLGIVATQVLISKDEMAQVFDYDPLVAEIDRIAEDGLYETQERLVTRIAYACAAYADIKTIDISLRKSPVRNGSGMLGVRLSLDEQAIDELRSSTLLGRVLP